MFTFRFNFDSQCQRMYEYNEFWAEIRQKKAEKEKEKEDEENH